MVPEAIKQYAKHLANPWDRGGMAFDPKDELDGLRERALRAIKEYKERKMYFEKRQKEIDEVNAWIKENNIE